MSKAFTSEETPDEGPLTRPPPRLAPGEVRYVTPEGQAALRSALEAARAEGPAGEALAARLSATLAVLTVLGPEAAPEGEVAFGSLGHGGGRGRPADHLAPGRAGRGRSGGAGW